MKQVNKTPYLIAEIGCNHNGDPVLAREMIKAAKDCGADAVKFQYFDEYNLATDKYLDELESGEVKLENVQEWKSPELNLGNIREQVKAFINSKAELEDYRNYCKELDIDFGCTAVDPTGVEFLKEIKSDFIKLASMDMDNPHFVEIAAQSGLPIIISTGMSVLSEIDEIYRLLKKMKVKVFSLLHCVSIYPPDSEIVNLNFIETLRLLYDCKIGYSDHTLGSAITLAAIAKGAEIIEKHFTMDKNMPGWDHKVSADVEDLKIIRNQGDEIYKALGNSYKELSAAETEKRLKFRRSLTSAREIKKGEPIQLEDLSYKRPGTGISPSQINHTVGRVAKRDIPKDTTLFSEDLV